MEGGPVASARLRAVEAELESQRALSERHADEVQVAVQRAEQAEKQSEEFKRGYETQVQLATQLGTEVDSMSVELQRSTEPSGTWVRGTKSALDAVFGPGERSVAVA